jgi:hypothetical protein
MIGFQIDDSRNPVVNGTAGRRVARAMDDIEHEVARTGTTLVKNRLNRVLRNQTPYYRTRVRAERVGGRWAVTDGGVIYGPWLEGTGSMNKTTRFKGYGTFRKAQSEIQGRSARIAHQVLSPVLARL